MDSKTYSARTTYYIYIKKLILLLDYTKIKPQNNQKKKKTQLQMENRSKFEK